MSAFIDMHCDHFSGRGRLSHPWSDRLWVHHLPRLPRREDTPRLSAGPERRDPHHGAAPGPRGERQRRRRPEDAPRDGPGRLASRRGPGCPAHARRRMTGRAPRLSADHHADGVGALVDHRPPPRGPGLSHSCGGRGGLLSRPGLSVRCILTTERNPGALQASAGVPGIVQPSVSRTGPAVPAWFILEFNPD